MSELAALEERGLAELKSCGDEAALRAWNTQFFGKQGEVTLALKRVGECPPAERKAYGQEANRVKTALTAAYDAALASAQEQKLARDLADQTQIVSALKPEEPSGPKPESEQPAAPQQPGRKDAAAPT